MDSVVLARQFTVDNRTQRSVLKQKSRRRSSAATLPATFYTIQVEQPVTTTKKGVHFPVSVLLQQAITEGDRNEITQLLKDYGNIVVEEREPSGLPPVMRAIFEGQLDCLKMLVQSGAELTATDPEGWNVLHVAAAMDDMDAARFITEACSNEQLTQVRNVDGQRPIDLAESPEMARFLLYADLQEMRIETTRNSKDSQTTNEDQLLDTVRDHYEANADCEFLNVMLQSQTEFDSILHLAAAKNFPRLAYYTLKHQIVDQNGRDRMGWTPLHMAAYYGSVDVLLLLIEFGASIHSITDSYEKSSDLTDHELILDILTEEEGM